VRCAYRCAQGAATWHLHSYSPA